ncbi:hypothetical protein [Ectobacillus polymachus]|uniref:hypothetical protein n=1 Tax=Ectobacillus polymachus TaxID=1508806 RepID=UPI003A83B15A
MKSFQVGQVWWIVAREHEPEAQIIILGVEPFQDSTVVHVQIVGIQMEGLDGEILTEVGHVPVFENRVRASIRTYEGETEVKDFEAIEYWRNAGGGVFDKCLAEIVNYIEKTLQEES